LNDVLAPAFPESVLASQSVFRAVMDAFARPGEIKPLPPAPNPPAPLSATAAAVAATLLDYETPVWLDHHLSRAPDVAEWLRFHTGVRVTGDPGLAAFALIADVTRAPPFDAFCLGTAEYPDRSTTLVLEVQAFGQGRRLSLSGPGIADVVSFAAAPLPLDLGERLLANRALFPRGVDLILVAPDAVVALPRSVRVAAEGA
jgi:alpha-D-ribose 1-methylphosphonate 5-triphosphate synthase subunit PhnH